MGPQGGRRQGRCGRQAATTPQAAFGVWPHDSPLRRDCPLKARPPAQLPNPARAANSIGGGATPARRRRRWGLWVRAANSLAVDKCHSGSGEEEVGVEVEVGFVQP